MSLSLFYTRLCNTKKRQVICFLCGLVLACALVPFGVVTLRAVFGYRETGLATTPDELPPFLRELSPFAAQWPVAYTYYRHPHGTAGYLVCGYGSEAQVETACRTLRLQMLEPVDDDEIQRMKRRVQEMTETLSGKERADFDKGPFARGDWSFYAMDRPGNATEGAFRRSDGYFAIIGVRVLHGEEGLRPSQ
jgi:hypothetical protein